MPDPVDTIFLLVEAAVAVAGFSGVVVVFGRRTTGAWTAVERARLQNLLSTSFSVLFFSLGSLVLLHAGVEQETTWLIGGVVWSIVCLWQITVVARQVRAIPASDPSRPRLTVVIALLGVLFLVAILNVWNALLAAPAFWPFLSGLVWLLALAWYSFARLLLVAGSTD